MYIKMTKKENTTKMEPLEVAMQGEQETAKAKTADEGQKVKRYTVKVNANPSYCGIGAGSTQFANGKAHITSERMAEWFREHSGYTVTEE